MDNLTNQPVAPSEKVVTPINNEDILVLLKNQNLLLKNIEYYLSKSIETEGKVMNIRSDIVDFDMSIGAMISLMFKWLIASIPVGIVIGILYAVFFGFLFGHR